MRKALAFFALAFAFMRALVVSGIQTAVTIVRPGHGAEPRLLRVAYAPMTPLGAALLGCLITLTPGTTTIDIDIEERELLLHVLDGRDPEGVARAVRDDFERWIEILFARRTP